MAATEGEGVMRDWSVYLQAAHGLGQAAVDDIADDLVDLLKPQGGSVSYDSQMLAARFDVRAADPESSLAKARRIFGSALRKARFPGEPTIIAAEVETVEDLDRRLQDSNVPPLVGIAEVADVLGVSKQRASELSRQPSFPRPLAALAAGPIWDRFAIARFVERWPRRRTGRPKQATHAPNFAEKPGR